MKRAILLCLLCVPATAADPTIDQRVQAYAGAPWVLVPTQDGENSTASPSGTATGLTGS